MSVRGMMTLSMAAVLLFGCTVARTSPILGTRSFKQNRLGYATGEGTTIVRGGPDSAWATCVLPPAQTVRTTIVESSGKAGADVGYSGLEIGAGGEGSSKSSNNAQVVNEYSETTLWSQRMLAELCFVFLNGGFGKTSDTEAKKLYLEHVNAVLAAGTTCLQAEQDRRQEENRVAAISAALQAMPANMDSEARQAYILKVLETFPASPTPSNTCSYSPPQHLDPPPSDEKAQDADRRRRT